MRSFSQPDQPAQPALLGEHLDAALEALRLWLPQQEWYVGGPAAPQHLEIVHAAVLRDDDPVLVDLLVDSGPSGDARALYQLPLAWRSDATATPPPPATGASVGVVGGRHLYDATEDPELMTWVLSRLAEGAVVAGVQFRPGPGAVMGVGDPPLRQTTPQRNTSVLFGECCILKFYRRLDVGPNPEIELLRALAEAGNMQVPTPRGAMHTETPLGPVDLANLEEFIPSGTDGWRMASASVRDLYAEGDLYAEEVGGDFAAEAFRLGEVVAGMHHDLAATLGSDTLAPAGVADRIGRAQGRLEQTAAEVPAVAELLDPLMSEMEAARSAAEEIPIQRIHGDIDLTEVLRTLRGWVIIDFEGDPRLSLAERRRMRSPMRDVAGLLRSLDYAARHMLIGLTGDNRLAVRAGDWITRNREALLSGYQKVRPVSDAEVRMLRVLELDKAVGEALHEARYRPSWLSVPMGYLEEHEERRDA